MRGKQESFKKVLVPMLSIDCRYRALISEGGSPQPVCQIVAELTDRPLAECHVNDSACAYCLSCGIAPQAPNKVTASMAIGVAMRSGNQAFQRELTSRFRHLLEPPPPATACVLRGSEIRQVACKPCQGGGNRQVLVPVFACPLHQECTLHNTGTHPRIQACATCAERQETETTT